MTQSLGADEGLNVGVVADVDDFLALDRHGVRPGSDVCDGVDRAVAEDDVGVRIVVGDRLGDEGWRG